MLLMNQWKDKEMLLVVWIVESMKKRLAGSTDIYELFLSTWPFFASRPPLDRASSTRFQQIMLNRFLVPDDYVWVFSTLSYDQVFNLLYEYIKAKTF